MQGASLRLDTDREGHCGGIVGEADEEDDRIEICTDCLERPLNLHFDADAEVRLVTPHELIDRFLHDDRPHFLGAPSSPADGGASRFAVNGERLVIPAENGNISSRWPRSSVHGTIAKVVQECPFVTEKQLQKSAATGAQPILVLFPAPAGRNRGLGRRHDLSLPDESSNGQQSP